MIKETLQRLIDKDFFDDSKLIEFRRLNKKKKRLSRIKKRIKSKRKRIKYYKNI